MEIIVRTMDRGTPDTRPVEVVERKGQGHPDTLCDAIAERISVKLSHAYLEAAGMVLHHNVDKVLLCGGSARRSFGGGEVEEPIEIHLTGRVTREISGTKVPVEAIAVQACREVLAEHVRELDVDRHVRIQPHFRGGSIDLTELFAREPHGAPPLANDTSIGVGFAPRTDLERVVFAAERALASATSRRKCPAIGDDVKVMGLRRDGRISLIVACAMVAAHVPDLAAYLSAKEAVRAFVSEAAASETQLDVEVAVNTADDPSRGSVYLTVTGTSAEAGDDGEVGRGNRTSGLITPYRPMTLEAAAGKNPVTHVGKLYSLLAERAAIRLCSERPDIKMAEVVMVSKIGHPVTDPQLVDIAVQMRDPAARLPSPDELSPILDRVLQGLLQLREDLLAGRVKVV